MNKISPIVITSKKADDHYSDMQNQYGDIIRGINDQSQRVAQYNQLKAQQATEQQAADMELKRTQMEDARKAEELAIKRMALASSY